MTAPVTTQQSFGYAPSFVRAHDVKPVASEQTTTQRKSHNQVTPELIDAILAGETEIVRRVEIYEADGVTPWSGMDDIDGNQIKPRIVAGGVSISSGSDSRRNLDITLENSDGLISHNPDGGLWYDKIIKPFRGVKYRRTNRQATAAVVTQTGADPNRIGPYLAQIGLTDVTYVSDATVANLANYDVIVAYYPFADFSDSTAALLAQCYNAGYSVLTFNARATPDSIPLLTSVETVTVPDSVYWIVSPQTADTPWAGAHRFYRSPVFVDVGMTLPTGKAATTLAGTLPIVSSVTYYSALYEENSAGGRWFHYHIDLIRPFSNHFSGANQAYYHEEKKLLRAAVTWLFNYQTDVYYETQCGEFMIDRISEPRFPHQIQITGRDYSKKLDLSKFLVPTTYAAGSSLYDTIQAIIVSAGITRYNIGLQFDNQQDGTLLTDAAFDRGTSKLDALKNLSEAYTFEWFFDRTGTLIVRAFRDPVTSPATLILTAGGYRGNLIDFSKVSDDTEMRNLIIVTGQSSDGSVDLYFGSAANDDESSPTNRARVGERADFYTSAFYTSNEQCQAFAESVLAVKSLEAYELDFSSLVFPWVEVGEILEFYANGDDIFPTRFLFTDANIPFDLSPMGGTGKRVALVQSGSADDLYNSSVSDTDFEPPESVFTVSDTGDGFFDILDGAGDTADGFYDIIGTGVTDTGDGFFDIG